jgi:hypothetical protein
MGSSLRGVTHSGVSLDKASGLFSEESHSDRSISIGHTNATVLVHDEMVREIRFHLCHCPPDVKIEDVFESPARLLRENPGRLYVDDSHIGSIALSMNCDRE